MGSRGGVRGPTPPAVDPSTMGPMPRSTTGPPRSQHAIGHPVRQATGAAIGHTDPTVARSSGTSAGGRRDGQDVAIRRATPRGDVTMRQYMHSRITEEPDDDPDPTRTLAARPRRRLRTAPDAGGACTHPGPRGHREPGRPRAGRTHLGTSRRSGVDRVPRAAPRRRARPALHQTSVAALGGFAGRPSADARAVIPACAAGA